MRWNRDDETLLLVLVPALETVWNIMCEHENVLRHLFWAFLGFVSCWALSPCWGCLLVAPNPSSPLVIKVQ